MKSTYQSLVDSYASWLKERISISELTDACEITTPFLDRHNDQLQIYVERKDQRLRLTDDGYTLADLEASGVSLSTPHRQALLRTILGGHGLALEGEELCTFADESNFPQRKHSLLQGMLAVGDMFLTSKGNVTSIFFEEVRDFLDLAGVRYASDIQFQGRSGFSHKFDFVIPKSRSHGERVMKVINSPTKERASALIFAWEDSHASRPSGSKAFAILNDNDRTVPSDVVSALSSYGIVPVPWSHRDEYANEFAA